MADDDVKSVSTNTPIAYDDIRVLIFEGSHCPVNEEDNAHTQANSHTPWREDIPKELDYDRTTVAAKSLVYGTAWKKEQTTELVYNAIKAGFRKIATAAQPKHYREDLVAAGVNRAIQEGIVTREDLTIQTTFTGMNNQDPENVAYAHGPDTTPDTQCLESIGHSQELFRTNQDHDASTKGYLDEIMLHEMYLDDWNATQVVWQAMSQAQMEGQCKSIGVSNVTEADLDKLTRWCTYGTSIPPLWHRFPKIVQNRLHKDNSFDVEVRQICWDFDITYQAFGVLKHNFNVLQDPATVGYLADHFDVSRPAALYALIIVALCPPGDPGNFVDRVNVVHGQVATLEVMKTLLEDVTKVIIALKDALLWWVVQDKHGRTYKPDAAGSNPPQQSWAREQRHDYEQLIDRGTLYVQSLKTTRDMHKSDEANCYLDLLELIHKFRYRCGNAW